MQATDQLEENGYQLLRGVFSRDECESLATEMDGVFQKHQATAKSKIGGVRNLLSHPRVRTFATSSRLVSILRSWMAGEPFPVRAIFFDKTPETNWLVPWHQDLAIAVAARIETPRFSGWSVKEGVTHVQPPAEILERMVTVRIHLDDCGADNGALKVIPGSHAFGKLDAPAISRSSARNFSLCVAQQGDALLMRPLVLHASSPAENPRHRRVLHIEYSAEELPNGLEWLERI